MSADFKLSATLRGHEEDVSTQLRGTRAAVTSYLPDAC